MVLVIFGLTNISNCTLSVTLYNDFVFFPLQNVNILSLKQKQNKTKHEFVFNVSTSVLQFIQAWTAHDAFAKKLGKFIRISNSSWKTHGNRTGGCPWSPLAIIFQVVIKKINIDSFGKSKGGNVISTSNEYQYIFEGDDTWIFFSIL